MSCRGTPVRTLVVWCPDWPLVAAGIPADTPAAVVHANRVMACTAAARAEGIRPGLRRREAQGRCPDVVIVAWDPSRDARRFEPVVATVETFTPRVEVTRPGTCSATTRGPSRYFGGDDALAAGVASEVNAVLDAFLPGALPAGVGIADSPFAAELAARRRCVVPPGDTAAFLAPFPVRHLDDPDLADLLVRLGLPTLGAFARIPARQVEARFGTTGMLAHRRACGLDDRFLDARDPPDDLTVSIELDPPADRADTAAFAAKAIAGELCDRLAEAGLSCTCVRIEGETEHGEHLARVWRHHRSFTPNAVADRVRWQLDGWLAQHRACGCSPPEDLVCPGGSDCPNPIGGTSGGLTLLRLVPEEVVPDGGRQQGFWGGDRAGDERASRGLARVQGLLGPEAVVTAVIGGGRGPGERVRLIPWGDPRGDRRGDDPPPKAPASKDLKAPEAAPKRVRKPARPGTRVRTAGRNPSASEIPAWPGRVPSPAPALVHRRPVPVELCAEDGRPVGVSGRGLLTATPRRVSVSGGPWNAIETWAGPWPVEERWWDPATRRRLARLQVALAGGTAYLLALEAGRWAIEATYD